MLEEKRNKEVQSQVKKEVKKIFLLDIINALKEGKRPPHISKELNITKQLLSYYMNKLKVLGYIKKVGYGVWEVTKRSTKLTKDTREVRGHAFMWKVKIPHIQGWNNRINILEKLGIKYKLIGPYQKTPRIMFKDRKIWLGKKYLIIYEPKSFIGYNATESQKHAVSSLIELLNTLEYRLKVSFKIKGNYQFKVRRHHYALMKNLIAKQCNKEGKIINIFYEGDLWFIIDNSHNLQEAETVHTPTAKIDNIGFQNYMNSHKRTEFKVTPDFILTAMNGITQNQLIFDKNMKSHLKILKELGEAVRDLTKKVGGLK